MKKVLLVDDEDDILKIGKLSLEAIGRFEAVIANNAVDALALAASERPDLILMDMMMPGMDGLSALAKLQQDAVLKHIPVVFMTAKVQRSEVAHYLAMGAKGVIQKPFDPMTLPDELRRLVDPLAT